MLKEKVHMNYPQEILMNDLAASKKSQVEVAFLWRSLSLLQWLNDDDVLSEYFRDLQETINTLSPLSLTSGEHFGHTQGSSDINPKTDRIFPMQELRHLRYNNENTLSDRDPFGIVLPLFEAVESYSRRRRTKEALELCVSLAVKSGRGSLLLRSVLLLLDHSNAPHKPTLVPEPILNPQILKDMEAYCMLMPTSYSGNSLTPNSHRTDSETGEVYASVSFGKGDHGKLGLGDTQTSVVIPTILDTLLGKRISKVSSMSTYTLAVEAEGRVYAWGSGSKSAASTSNTSYNGTYALPQVLDSIPARYVVRELSCGLGHALFLTNSGRVLSWGNGGSGRLGLGDCVDRQEACPIIALGETVVVRIKCGASHSLALDTQGTLHTWGKNSQGQCGLGHTEDVLTPTVVSLMECPVIEIAAGWEHSLAVSDDGALYSWGGGYRDSRRGVVPPVLGHGNVQGQTEGSGFESRTYPEKVAVTEELRIVQVASGWDHCLALDSEGRVLSWGAGQNGKLGHGSEENISVPLFIPGLEEKGGKIKAISTGCEHSAAVGEDGTLYTWGHGDGGRLGHGDTAAKLVPEAVRALQLMRARVEGVYCGDKFTIAMISSAPRKLSAAAATGTTTSHARSTNAGRKEAVEIPANFFTNIARSVVLADPANNLSSDGENKGVSTVLLALMILDFMAQCALNSPTPPINSVLEAPLDLLPYCLDRACAGVGFLLELLEHLATRYTSLIAESRNTSATSNTSLWAINGMTNVPAVISDVKERDLLICTAMIESALILMSQAASHETPVPGVTSSTLGATINTFELNRIIKDDCLLGSPSSSRTHFRSRSNTERSQPLQSTLSREDPINRLSSPSLRIDVSCSVDREDDIIQVQKDISLQSPIDNIHTISTDYGNMLTVRPNRQLTTREEAINRVRLASASRDRSDRLQSREFPSPFNRLSRDTSTHAIPRRPSLRGTSELSVTPQLSGILQSCAVSDDDFYSMPSTQEDQNQQNQLCVEGGNHNRPEIIASTYAAVSTSNLIVESGVASQVREPSNQIQRTQSANQQETPFRDVHSPRGFPLIPSANAVGSLPPRSQSSESLALDVSDSWLDNSDRDPQMSPCPSESSLASESIMNKKEDSLFSTGTDFHDEDSFNIFGEEDNKSGALFGSESEYFEEDDSSSAMRVEDDGYEIQRALLLDAESRTSEDISNRQSDLSFLEAKGMRFHDSRSIFFSLGKALEVLAQVIFTSVSQLAIVGDVPVDLVVDNNMVGTSLQIWKCLQRTFSSNYSKFFCDENWSVFSPQSVATLSLLPAHCCGLMQSASFLKRYANFSDIENGLIFCERSLLLPRALRVAEELSKVDADKIWSISYIPHILDARGFLSKQYFDFIRNALINMNDLIYGTDDHQSQAVSSRLRNEYSVIWIKISECVGVELSDYIVLLQRVAVSTCTVRKELYHSMLAGVSFTAAFSKYFEYLNSQDCPCVGQIVTMVSHAMAFTTHIAKAIERIREIDVIATEIFSEIVAPLITFSCNAIQLIQSKNEEVNFNMSFVEDSERLLLRYSLANFMDGSAVFRTSFETDGSESESMTLSISNFNQCDSILNSESAKYYCSTAFDSITVKFIIYTFPFVRDNEFWSNIGIPPLIVRGCTALFPMPSPGELISDLGERSELKLLFQETHNLLFRIVTSSLELEPIASSGAIIWILTAAALMLSIANLLQTSALVAQTQNLKLHAEDEVVCDVVCGVLESAVKNLSTLSKLSIRRCERSIEDIQFLSTLCQIEVEKSQSDNTNEIINIRRNCLTAYLNEFEVELSNYQSCCSKIKSLQFVTIAAVYLNPSDVSSIVEIAINQEISKRCHALTLSLLLMVLESATMADTAFLQIVGSETSKLMQFRSNFSRALAHKHYERLHTYIEDQISNIHKDDFDCKAAKLNLFMQILRLSLQLANRDDSNTVYTVQYLALRIIEFLSTCFVQTSQIKSNTLQNSANDYVVDINHVIYAMTALYKIFEAYPIHHGHEYADFKTFELVDAILIIMASLSTRLECLIKKFLDVEEALEKNRGFSLLPSVKHVQATSPAVIPNIISPQGSFTITFWLKIPSNITMLKNCMDMHIVSCVTETSNMNIISLLTQQDSRGTPTISLHLDEDGNASLKMYWQEEGNQKNVLSTKLLPNDSWIFCAFVVREETLEELVNPSTRTRGAKKLTRSAKIQRCIFINGELHDFDLDSFASHSNQQFYNIVIGSVPSLEALKHQQETNIQIATVNWLPVALNAEDDYKMYGDTPTCNIFARIQLIQTHLTEVMRAMDSILPLVDISGTGYHLRSAIVKALLPIIYCGNEITSPLAFNILMKLSYKLKREERMSVNDTDLIVLGDLLVAIDDIIFGGLSNKREDSVQSMSALWRRLLHLKGRRESFEGLRKIFPCCTQTQDFIHYVCKLFATELNLGLPAQSGVLMHRLKELLTPDCFQFIGITCSGGWHNTIEVNHHLYITPTDQLFTLNSRQSVIQERCVAFPCRARVQQINPLIITDCDGCFSLAQFLSDDESNSRDDQIIEDQHWLVASIFSVEANCNLVYPRSLDVVSTIKFPSLLPSIATPDTKQLLQHFNFPVIGPCDNNVTVDKQHPRKLNDSLREAEQAMLAFKALMTQEFLSTSDMECNNYYVGEVFNNVPRICGVAAIDEMSLIKASFLKSETLTNLHLNSLKACNKFKFIEKICEDNSTFNSDAASESKLWNPTQRIIVHSGDVQIIGDSKIRALVHFPTVTIPSMVCLERTGRFFYEVLLHTDGLIQIGWAASAFKCDPLSGQGVGDHSSSWAFDGLRGKRWNVSCDVYGKRWRQGDIVGVLLDTDLLEMRFYLNGEDLGQAFGEVPLSLGLFPAVSLNVRQSIRINYGNYKFAHPPDEVDGRPYLPVKDALAELKYNQKQLDPTVSTRAIKDTLSTTFHDKAIGESLFDIESEHEPLLNRESNLALGTLQLSEISGVGLGIYESGEDVGEKDNVEEVDHGDDGDDDDEDEDDLAERRQSMIDNLMSMGFPFDFALRAADNVDSTSHSSAISWILQRMEAEQVRLEDGVGSGGDSSRTENGDEFDAEGGEVDYNNHLGTSVGDRLPHRTAARRLLRTIEIDGAKNDVNVLLSEADVSHSRSNTANTLELFNMGDSKWKLSIYTPVISFCETRSSKEIDAENREFLAVLSSPDTMESSTLLAACRLLLTVNYARAMLLHIFDRMITSYYHSKESMIQFVTTLSMLPNSELFEMLQQLFWGSIMSWGSHSSRLCSVFENRCIPPIDLFYVNFHLAYTPATVTASLEKHYFKDCYIELFKNAVFAKGTITLSRFLVVLFELINSDDPIASVIEALLKDLFQYCISKIEHVSLSNLSHDFICGHATTHSSTPIVREVLFAFYVLRVLWNRNTSESTIFPTRATSVLFDCISNLNPSLQYLASDLLTIVFTHNGNNNLIFPNPLKLNISLFVLIDVMSRRTIKAFSTTFTTEVSNRAAVTCQTRSTFTMLLQVQRLLIRHGLDTSIELFSAEKNRLLSELTHSAKRSAITTETLICVVSVATTSLEVAWNFSSVHCTYDNDSIQVSLKLEATEKLDSDPENPTHIFTCACNRGSHMFSALTSDTSYKLSLMQQVCNKSRSSLEEKSSRVENPEIQTIAAMIVSTNRVQPLEFDSHHLSSNTSLSVIGEGRTLRNTVNKKWSSCKGAMLMTSGVHRWDVRIDKCASKNIFIGVCTPNAKMENYIGCDQYGYGFLANKALWHNKVKLRTYGQLFRTGDVVSSILDMDQGTLSFAINGSDLGVAIESLFGMALSPAFSLYNEGDQLTLLATAPAGGSSAVRGVLSRAVDLCDILSCLYQSYESIEWTSALPSSLVDELTLRAILASRRSTVLSIFHDGGLVTVIRDDWTCRQVSGGSFSLGDTVLLPQGVGILWGVSSRRLCFRMVDDGSTILLCPKNLSDLEMNSINSGKTGDRNPNNEIDIKHIFEGRKWTISEDKILIAWLDSVAEQRGLHPVELLQFDPFSEVGQLLDASYVNASTNISIDEVGCNGIDTYNWRNGRLDFLSTLASVFESHSRAEVATRAVLLMWVNDLLVPLLPLIAGSMEDRSIPNGHPAVLLRQCKHILLRGVKQDHKRRDCRQSQHQGTSSIPIFLKPIPPSELGQIIGPDLTTDCTNALVLVLVPQHRLKYLLRLQHNTNHCTKEGMECWKLLMSFQTSYIGQTLKYFERLSISGFNINVNSIADSSDSSNRTWEDVLRQVAFTHSPLDTVIAPKSRHPPLLVRLSRKSLQPSLASTTIPQSTETHSQLPPFPQSYSCNSRQSSLPHEHLTETLRIAQERIDKHEEVDSSQSLTFQATVSEWSIFALYIEACMYEVTETLRRLYPDTPMLHTTLCAADIGRLAPTWATVWAELGDKSVETLCALSAGEIFILGNILHTAGVVMGLAARVEVPSAVALPRVLALTLLQGACADEEPKLQQPPPQYQPQFPTSQDSVHELGQGQGQVKGQELRCVDWRRAVDISMLLGHSLRLGLSSMLPQTVLSMFHWGDIVRLLSETRVVTSLRTRAHYCDGANDTDPHIACFWAAAGELSCAEQRQFARLLRPTVSQPLEAVLDCAAYPCTLGGRATHGISVTINSTSSLTTLESIAPATTVPKLLSVHRGMCAITLSREITSRYVSEVLRQLKLLLTI